MKKPLKIRKNAWDVMKSDATSSYPEECCGFFFGKNGDQKVVSTAYPVDNRNETNRKRRFEIDPKDYMAAEKYAVDQNVDLLGVYHSHPDHPALPSETDRSQALPWFSYIIISVKEGNAQDTRSWVLNEARQFEEEIIEIN
jgi:proteasome lid subunit RPN8/RPN11